MTNTENVLPTPADRADIEVGKTYDLHGIITVTSVTVRNGWVYVHGTNARGNRCYADLHRVAQ